MQETSLLEKIKISKELVSAVLGFKTEVNSISQITKHEIVLNYDSECGCCNESINLDTFVRLCKKWVFKKYGYSVGSLYSGGSGDYATLEQTDCKDGTDDFMEVFEADSEIEAIIKACELILKNERRK